MMAGTRPPILSKSNFIKAPLNTLKRNQNALKFQLVAPWQDADSKDSSSRVDLLLASNSYCTVAPRLAHSHGREHGNYFLSRVDLLLASNSYCTVAPRLVVVKLGNLKYN